MKNNPHRLLLLEFWVPVLICLCIIILYENDILLSGGWHDNKINEYYVAIAMEFITICLIPISLRLFKFRGVRRAFQSSADIALQQWGSVRLAMLTLPMLVNCWLYYQFMNVAFGYMGIIGLLSLCFVYPSKARCTQETIKQETSEKIEQEKK